MKPAAVNERKMRGITEKEFMSLVNNDSVYLAICGRFYLSKVIGKPFWNSDADDPGWEIETNNGYSDMYSIYVASEEPSNDEQRDCSLDGILNNYFHGGVLEHDAAYNLLVSLIYDLESLGVLPDANDVITKLDEIDSEKE